MADYGPFIERRLHPGKQNADAVCVDSTPTFVSYFFDIASLGTGEFGKFLEDLLISHFGIQGFLLIVLVFTFLRLCHQRNQIAERDDREKSFDRALAASKMRADALEERLRLSGDQSQLVEERGKIIEQRNLLTDQRLAAGEDLLRLMNEMRSIVRFHIQPSANTLSGDILLVEDEKALHSFKEGIEAESPRIGVRLASNGAEAWTAMLKRRPNLIITDLVMPVLDGYELIRRLAQQYPDIPVLIISAYSDQLHDVAAKIGVLPSKFEFLPKPLLLQTLLDAIERLMLDHRGDNEASSLAI